MVNDEPCDSQHTAYTGKWKIERDIERGATKVYSLNASTILTDGPWKQIRRIAGVIPAVRYASSLALAYRFVCACFTVHSLLSNFLEFNRSVVFTTAISWLSLLGW